MVSIEMDGKSPGVPRKSWVSPSVSMEGPSEWYQSQYTSAIWEACGQSTQPCWDQHEPLLRWRRLSVFTAQPKWLIDSDDWQATPLAVELMGRTIPCWKPIDLTVAHGAAVSFCSGTGTPISAWVLHMTLQNGWTGLIIIWKWGAVYALTNRYIRIIAVPVQIHTKDYQYLIICWEYRNSCFITVSW